MPNSESSLPADWLEQGDLDIRAAEILLEQDGPQRVIAFHIQQAIEKYLKGYLLSQSWPLRRIHDLEVLIQEAITRDNDFSPFLSSCQKITEYYIESRYPLGIYTTLTNKSLKRDLETVRQLVILIHQKILPPEINQDNDS